MEGYLKLMTVDETLSVLHRHWPGPRSSIERLRLESCFGRVLAHDYDAAMDVPAFDRATMDGYAVRAQDTFGASEGLPSLLRLIGQVFMGEEPPGEVAAGEAMRIATGGMMPPGANAVVMIEHTESMDEETLLVMKPAAPGENVLARADDVAAGDRLFTAGRLLSPADIGVLASLGETEIDVCCFPRVGIISTGDELVEAGQPLGPGQIYDINSLTLASLCAAMGLEARRYGIVGDDFMLLYKTLERARRECDLVILSGGTSVGVRDLTVRVINESGQPGVLVHGLNLKPGKPTIVALLGQTPVFGLSGNPVTAALTFQLLVEPTLARWPGVKVPSRATVEGRLNRNVASATGFETYVRANVVRSSEQIEVQPVLGRSGQMTTLALADGYFLIPAGREGASAGEMVKVTLLR